MSALGQKPAFELSLIARGSEAVGGVARILPWTPPFRIRRPWNKGLIVGQKRPLLPRQVWSIRVRLEMSASARDLALFNLAIDSKLRASDLVRLKVEDVCSGRVVRDRGVVIQRKTGRPVQFEITEVTRQSVERLLASQPSADGYLFRPYSRARSHLRTAIRSHRPPVDRQHRARRPGFGTHSLRRTKVAQLYRKTGNLRAVQLLLGHAKIETTVRYLGVEVDDALRLAEQIEL